jgi:hypothetical protein
MAKRGETAEIVDAVMLHRPGLAERQLGETPAADALLVGVAGEDGVGTLPFLCRQGLLPDRLALGPHDTVGAILFELLAGAAVEQRIIGIGRHFQDHRKMFGGQGAFAAGQDARRRVRFGTTFRLRLMALARWRFRSGRSLAGTRT